MVKSEILCSLPPTDFLKEENVSGENGKKLKFSEKCVKNKGFPTKNKSLEIFGGKLRNSEF